MNLLKHYSAKIITITFLILSFFDIKASDFMYEIGKAHHLIKMNYPIKNFKQFPWDEQLCDLLKESDFGKMTNDELLNFLNTKYSYLGGDVRFTKQAIPDIISDDKSVYAYKHIGVGFVSYLPMKRKSSYYSTIIKVKPPDSEVIPNSTYRISDRVFLHIQLPEKLKKANYITSTTISEKELNLDRKETRAASLLKCFFTYSTLLSAEQMQERKTLLLELLAQSNAITTKERNFMDIMRLLVASFNDGHGVYFCNKKIAPLVYAHVSQYYPKVSFEKSQDRITVSALDSSLSQHLKVGDELFSVNGMSALDYLAYQERFHSGATNSHKTSKVMAELISTWTKDSTFSVVVKRENNLLETKLVCSESRAFTTSKTAVLPIIQRIDSKTHLINLTHKDFSYKAFLKNLDSIKTSDRLVLNLVGYPNYNADKVLSHFIDTPISTPDFKSQVSYSNSSLKEWINDPWSIKPHKEKVPGKELYFLMGNNMSWPETLLEMAKTYKLGTTIGEPTFNSNGDISFVKLPAGTFLLTGLKVERDGLNPYPMTPDIHAELNEIDTTEKILNILNSKNTK